MLKAPGLSSSQAQSVMMTTGAWFDGIDIDDTEATARSLVEGSAETPDDWPRLAIETGRFTDEETYYDRLHSAALDALRDELATFAEAPDRELVHLVRTHDAVAETVNELHQRIADVRTERGASSAAEQTPLTHRIERLEELTAELHVEVDELERATRQHALSVAPNLTTLAGAMLAARLIAEAGSLDDLAKMSSSTVQLLGAESALFAHLRGQASSPKHGIIFMHPAVRSAPGDDRGRIARALAGKLAIAARIDTYRGELEPTLEEDWADRLHRIRGEVTE